MTCLSNRIIVFFFVLTAKVALSAQVPVELHSRWNDSFREWALIDEEGYEGGALRLRWGFQNDWTEWEFNWGHQNGSIVQRGGLSNSYWELRFNGRIIVARPRWPGDAREWRVEGSDYTLYFGRTYGNIYDSWTTTDDRYGSFQIRMEWQNDPRDWVINDQLQEEIDLEASIFLAFLAMFYSSPKQ